MGNRISPSLRNVPQGGGKKGFAGGRLSLQKKVRGGGGIQTRGSNIKTVGRPLANWAAKRPRSTGPILVRTRPQRGGRVNPPPLQTPKWLYRTMGFVGARGAGDFVLGIRQGEIFLFRCVCTQNTQNFVENSKMAEKHKKGF